MRPIFAILLFWVLLGSTAAAEDTPNCQTSIENDVTTQLDAIRQLRVCYQDMDAIMNPGDDVDNVIYAKNALERIKTSIIRSEAQLCATGLEDGCELYRRLSDRATYLTEDFMTRQIDRQSYLSDFRMNESYRASLVIGRDAVIKPIFLCGEFLRNGSTRETGSCQNIDALQVPCDAQCNRRKNSALALIPTMIDMATLAAKPQVGAVFAQEAERNSAIWRTYVLGDDKISGMTIWEAALNEWLVTPNGNDLGFVEPKTHQFVALRPSLGVTAYNSKGENVDFAGLIEVFGVKWWREWNDKGERVKPMGVSAIVAYNPSETTDDFGFGLKVDNVFRNIDVSVVGRDWDDGPEVAVMFSVDISAILPKVGLEKGCEILGVPNC
ncbi:hypothetical protein ACFFUB_06430 [Algimonas porphyrae]|uniref:Uncharacterized protein n=1 Tax=Algimonas porphyrae TaxID=1128113 RepID=A0ABQ5V2M7_9PROT|nr:hypothetical protein [Algimonas porphyrae]GLQ21204.1 hypothetical protein GCM10007854_21590 [Algimonas porphyrae]